jgi:hypothetical protein
MAHPMEREPQAYLLWPGSRAWNRARCARSAGRGRPSPTCPASNWARLSQCKATCFWPRHRLSQAGTSGYLPVCTLPPTGARGVSLGSKTGLPGDIVHSDYDWNTAGGAWLDNGLHAALTRYRTL